MHVTATCPECGQQYKIKSELRGKTLRCKKCGAAFQGGPISELAPASDLTAKDPLGRPVKKSTTPPRKNYPAAAPLQPSSAALHPTLPTQQRKKTRKQKTSGDSGTENALRSVGVPMSVLGITGFLLPLAGLQWKMIHRLGTENMYYVSLGMSIFGAILIFLSYLDRLEIGIPTALIICVAALGLFWFAGDWTDGDQQAAVVEGGLQGPDWGPDDGIPRPPRRGPGAPGFPPGRGFGGQRPAAPGPPPSPRPPSSDRSEGDRSSAPPQADRSGQNAAPEVELKPFPPLGTPARILKEIPYTAAETETTEPAGRQDGLEFTDDAPAGGVLVGLRITLGNNWKGCIRAMQPVYQVADRYVLGETLGLPRGGVQNVEEMARPSYAVSGINVRAGMAVTAVQLEYTRVRDGVFVTSDTYTSDWIGGEGGAAKSFSGDGGYFVGLVGSFEEDVNSLQFSHTLQLLPSPQTALSGLSYNAQRAKLLGPAGSNKGFPFADVSPEGGILVGFRLSKGKSFGGAIHAIQPIYQVGDRYVFGKRHGKSGGTMSTVLARPGYAVGGLNIRSGLVLNAVQVIFCEVDGAELDRKKYYEDDWVGTDGGTPYQVHSSDGIAVGVVGTMEDYLHSLGLQMVNARVQN